MNEEAAPTEGGSSSESGEEGAVAGAFQKCGGSTLVTVCIVILILLLSSLKGLSPVEYGLIQNGISGVVDTTVVHQGGRNMIGFWNVYLTFPATLQTIEWTGQAPMSSNTVNLPSMSVRTREGLMVEVDLVAQYFLVQPKIPSIYMTYRNSYQSFFISVLRSGFQLAIADWTAQDLWIQREQVKLALKAECDRIASSTIQGMITCWDVQLLSVKLDSMIEDRIVDRQVQQQQQNLELMKQRSMIIRANTTVQESMFDKEVAIVNAMANRDAYNILNGNKSLADYNTEAAYGLAMYDIQDLVRSTGGAVELDAGAVVQYYQNSAFIESTKSEMVFGDYGSVNIFTKFGTPMAEGPGSARRLRESIDQPGKSEDLAAAAARILSENAHPTQRASARYDEL